MIWTILIIYWTLLSSRLIRQVILSTRLPANIVSHAHENTLKLSKLEFDLHFLQKCKIYNIFPKFLRFKLHKRTLQTWNFYKSWQAKLLLYEIKIKKQSISNKKTKIETYRNSARTNFSRIDFYVTNHWINKEIQKHNQLSSHIEKIVQPRN